MAKVSAVRPVKEKKHFVRYLPLYLMMVPGIAYIIINNYIPMTGIVVAFKQYLSLIHISEPTRPY